MRQRLETWLIWAEAVRGAAGRQPSQLGVLGMDGHVEAVRGTALCARRCCRSEAGHHPYQRITVNVGSVHRAPATCFGRQGRANAACCLMGVAEVP